MYYQNILEKVFTNLDTIIRSGKNVSIILKGKKKNLFKDHKIQEGKKKIEKVVIFEETMSEFTKSTKGIGYHM